jgi:hypothetical protein
MPPVPGERGGHPRRDPAICGKNSNYWGLLSVVCRSGYIEELHRLQPYRGHISANDPYRCGLSDPS